MATYVKFQPFVEALAEGKHDLSADTLKIALTNTAPNVTDATLSQITQITGGGSTGYTTGGATASLTTSEQVSGTYKLVLVDAQFVAGSSGMGPFRYAVLYNDTATNDELIAYWDYGSSITLADTETFTVDFSASNGVMTLA
jgi:hypothetical protein